VIFAPTAVDGVFVLEPERYEDERGFFARTWDGEELSARGLDGGLVQSSISWSGRRGTLRGLHYQAPPAEETKIVRCTAGSIHDVVLDLRAGSPTFRCHDAALLSAENRRAMYVPKGCAHGFVTLEDGAEVLYLMSTPHAPDLARGVRWDDPAFGIRWPEEVRVISERDRSYPDYEG
jgi:dTDP-4-dehydrorhamnose 3,5-epimerase